MPTNNIHTPPNASQACAACKHQRRKCAPNCTLAPYFPVNLTQDFLNAHMLFGISKIIKALSSVPPSARQNTVKCMVFEANTRSKDPVGGCYRIVRQLEHSVNMMENELDLVLRQLAVVRAHRGLVNPNPNPSLRFSNTMHMQYKNINPRVSLGGFGVYDEGGGKSINGLGVQKMEYPLPIRSVKIDQAEASCSYLHDNDGNIEFDDIKPGFG